MLLDAEIDLAKAAAPTGAPRGGAYTKREWSGTRWNYTYDKQPSGWQTVDKDAAEEFADRKQNAVKGIDADKTFDTALSKAKANPGEPATVRIPALDEDLTVTVTEVKGKSYIQLKDANGEVFGTKDKNGFKNQGQYDKYMIEASNTHVRFDTNGNPWLMVTPSVGKVDTASGELIPSQDKNRRWKVQYHPSVPTDQQKSDQDRAELGYAKSLEFAKERIDAKISNVGEPTIPFPEKPLSTMGSKDEGGSGITQDIETGSHSWTYNTEKNKRELDVTPAEKEKMISDLARDYWPVMEEQARKQVKMGGGFFGTTKDEKESWMGRMIGDRFPDSDERVDGKPIVVTPEPGSPAHTAISQAIDEWDPGTGVPLAGFAASKLTWAIKREADKFKDEISGTASGTVASESGGDVSRADITADPSSVREPTSSSFDFDKWHSQTEDIIDRLGPEHIKNKQKLEAAKQAARAALDDVANEPVASQQKVADRISELLLDMLDKSFVQEALIEKALLAYAYEDLAWKAMQILTKDKNVDPAHNYLQQDGDENLPRYYYQDQAGNYVRYTNAPTGHPDQSNYYGDAQIHPSEPTMDVAPEYFTPGGQKLSRCPDCEVEQVEWNQAYNRYDPQNLWAARWRSAAGDFRYSYIDADIRSMPKLQINQQNALTDVRMPVLRQGYNTMFNTSDRIKDQITGLALALLDQGRFRATELSTVCPMNVLVEGPLITIGTRRIYADHKVQAAISALMAQKQPDEPMFSIPLQKRDGKLEDGLYRRIGPHYLARVLDTQGISLIGMQTYHATLCFSREIQRALTNYDVSWETAKSNALLVTALEWGHDLRMEQDVMRVMQLIEQVLIDPLVVEALQSNAEEQGLIGMDTQALPPAMPPIPAVSMDLMGRTNDEQEFSDWVHSFPIHERAEPGEPI